MARARSLTRCPHAARDLRDRRGTPVTATDVAPGSHRLNVSAAGHEGTADTIEVQPGERDIMVRFKEVRLDAALDVVHKHRLGSCRGRLSATPQGLRYETSDKDDVFAAPLTAHRRADHAALQGLQLYVPAMPSHDLLDWMLELDV